MLYSGILLSHQKEWNNAICSHMDGPREYHTKWSKQDRPREYHTKWSKQDRQSKISYDIAYMWNQKKDTSELICITEIDPQT